MGKCVRKSTPLEVNSKTTIYSSVVLVNYNFN